MALGQLVVRLGLDAAEFTRGMKKAELSSHAFGQSIGRGLQSAGVAAKTGLLAAAAAAGATALAIDQLVKSASKFKDLEEKIGSSAEAIASMAVAAGTASVSFEAITLSSKNLTRAISGLDKESQAAVRALTALGIPLEQFKALDPVSQMEAVAKALAKFEDGANKTAVALALFGRSGEQMLPFLKELGQEGGRQVILTQKQIELADQYADAQGRLLAQAKLYAQSLAIDTLPALNELIKGFKTAIPLALGFEGVSKDLISANVKEWAQNAAIAIGTLAESLLFVARSMRAVIGSFEVVAAEIDVLLARTNAPSQKVTGALGFSATEAAEAEKQLIDALARRERIVKEADTRYINLIQQNATVITDSLRASFATPAALMEEFSPARIAKFGRTGIPTPVLNFKGPVKQAKELKAALDDVDRFLQRMSGQQFSIDTGIDEKTIADLELLTRAIARGLDPETAAKFRDQIFAASTAIKNLNAARAEQDAVNTRAITSSQDLLQTMQDEAGAIGLAADALIAYNIELQRKALSKGVTPGSQAQTDIDANAKLATSLAITNAARIKAVDTANRGLESGRAILAHYQAEAGAIGKTGIELEQYNILLAKRAALEGVIDPLAAANIESLFAAAEAYAVANAAARQFAEDAVTLNEQFKSSFADNIAAVADGTKSFKDAMKDMAKSWTQALNDMAAKKLAEAIFGAAGSSGGIGGFFASLFNTGGSSNFGMFTRGIGGPVAANTPYMVGEHGREMFVPRSGGVVIPNHNITTGGDTINVSQVINVPPGTSRQSMTQTLADAASRIQYAARRKR